VLAVISLVGAAIPEAKAGGRNPNPERVTVIAAGGIALPAGDFGERAEPGPTVRFGGYYRLWTLLNPAFEIQYATFDAKPNPAMLGATGPRRGTIDFYDGLVGLRAFLLPEGYLFRPWGTVMGGFAHYGAHPRLPLAPAFGRNRDDRDDPLLAIGGGVDLSLHPNFSLGFDARLLQSFTRNRDLGEEDLQTTALTAALVFHY
jgi:hypothetical protein